MLLLSLASNLPFSLPISPHPFNLSILPPSPPPTTHPPPDISIHPSTGAVVRFEARFLFSSRLLQSLLSACLLFPLQVIIVIRLVLLLPLSISFRVAKERKKGRAFFAPLLSLEIYLDEHNSHSHHFIASTLFIDSHRRYLSISSFHESILSNHFESFRLILILFETLSCDLSFTILSTFRF